MEKIVQYFRDNLAYYPPTRIRAAIIADELGVDVTDVLKASRQIAVGLQSLAQPVAPIKSKAPEAKITQIPKTTPKTQDTQDKE